MATAFDAAEEIELEDEKFMPLEQEQLEEAKSKQPSRFRRVIRAMDVNSYPDTRIKKTKEQK